MDLDEEDDTDDQQEEGLLIEADNEMAGLEIQEAILQADRSELESRPVYIDSLPLPEETVRDFSQVEPLLPDAKEYVLDILATLTGQGTALNPAPFPDEEKDEALNGMVNLLKGTVERGEGNSALLVGARGVGKTRVSCLLCFPTISNLRPLPEP